MLVYGMNLNLNMLTSSAEFIHYQEHSGDVSRGDDIRWYVFLDVLSLYGCYLGQVSIKKGFDVSGTSELNKVYYNNNNNNDKK